MEVRILENNGIVTNYDTVLDIFGDKMGKYITTEDLQQILEKGIEIFYFDAYSQKHTDITQIEEGSFVKIIKTSVIEKHTGYPICLSYTRGRDNEWRGCFVGTQYYLHKKWLSSANCPFISSVKEEKLQAKDNSLQEIYSSLFYKENWKYGSSLLRLEMYIKALKKKIENEYKKGNTDWLVLNKMQTRAIFNSRLLDCFGNFIYLIAPFRNGVLGEASCVKGLHTQTENGFSTSILNIPPVEFFKDSHELVFKCQLHEIDLTNMFVLNHIVNERRYRFPEDVQQRSTIEIVNALKIAIEHGVKMSQVDYKFVVPMYNIEHDKIQFLMPIYFSFGEKEQPDLALVVDKYNGFWNIRTILTIEDAYHNARVISSADVKWLRLN